MLTASQDRLKPPPEIFRNPVIFRHDAKGCNRMAEMGKVRRTLLNSE
jgi:hypothetical protein